jgi:type IV pilus assembly protein PilA
MNQKTSGLLRLLMWLAIVLGMAILGVVAMLPYPVFCFSPCGCGEYVCARVAELVLAGSSAKTAFAEGIQDRHTWSADWMSSITISATGAVASVSISPLGQIVVHGTAQTSYAVVTMTPIITTDYKLVWTCVGSPAKYMPASCRP